MERLVEWANALWGLWLMLIFIGICVWVFWPGRKKEMERHARIPLEEDEPGRPDRDDGRASRRKQEGRHADEG